MIISASRRTDIPCFYSEWFINRINAGYALARNPMNNSQVRRISLNPEDVDCIVFWTKDPLNMTDKLPLLDSLGYEYYFQFTLTPYGKDYEPCLRNKPDIQDSFIRLSNTIGSDRVLWRYDPIILDDFLTIGYHYEQFKRLCDRLHTHTSFVTISFVDEYAKLKDRVRTIEPDEMSELAHVFSSVAEQYNLPVKICCEADDFSSFGITPSACIDKFHIQQLLRRPLSVKQDKNQRAGCGCCESVDIGAYNTCGNGCVYCYANRSSSSANKNAARHNPYGEFLLS